MIERSLFHGRGRKTTIANKKANLNIYRKNSPWNGSEVTRLSIQQQGAEYIFAKKTKEGQKHQSNQTDNPDQMKKQAINSIK
jgi:hypothetical protein